MMADVCEHCHIPVFNREVIMREGFSYHKKCHKCYVCSETNLHNAEVFKGVIFCSSCAQRIFQGCASVKKTKQKASHRSKHTRSKSRRRRERKKIQEKRIDRDIHGVIELAHMAGTTSGSCDTVTTKTFIFKSSKEATTTMPIQVEQQGYDFQHKKSLKAVSLEMGTTTMVTQKLLKQINDPEISSFIKPASTKDATKEHIGDVPRNITPLRHRKKKKDIVPPRTNKQIVSDLRIAELGASTEIANMALRKKSEVPVIIKSETRMKMASSDSLSVLNQESEESRDDRDWRGSNYSSLNARKTSCLDRRLGSIMKLPYKFFKKNILARSSLISIAMSKNSDSNLIKRLKTLFNEEMSACQGRGVKRLYSTINRRKTPYRLGWLNLVAKVSKAMDEKSTKAGDTCQKSCKHFETSPSYRCMRAQAMRLAGPTPSQLAAIRKKIKRFVAPKCVRYMARGRKEST